MVPDPDWPAITKAPSNSRIANSQRDSARDTSRINDAAVRSRPARGDQR
jgi:hypothetical protein